MIKKEKGKGKNFKSTTPSAKKKIENRARYTNFSWKLTYQ